MSDSDWSPDRRMVMWAGSGWPLAWGPIKGRMPDADVAWPIAPDDAPCMAGHPTEYLALATSSEGQRRLVACWNACAGIPSAALESGALRAALEAARDSLASESDSAELEADKRLYEALKALGVMP